MKKKYSKLCIGVATASLVWSGSTFAEQLIWTHKELVNNPVSTPFGPRATTNVSFSDSSFLKNDDFPVAFLQTGATEDDLLNAEVTLDQESDNSLTIKTETLVSWTGPIQFGAWANANADLSAGFVLTPETGDPASVEKNITVVLEGSYEEFSINLDDGVTPIELFEGTNTLTLDLDKPYTINAHLYSFSDNTGSNLGAGKNTSAASMKIIVGEMAKSCHLTVTPAYSEGQLSLDVDLMSDTRATFTARLSTGPGQKRLINQRVNADQNYNRSYSFPISSQGTVGVLSTLRVRDTGITCSDWQTVDTGVNP